MKKRLALIAGVTLLLILGTACARFVTAQIRADYARANTNLRTLETGLETFIVDMDEFPAHASGAEGMNASLGGDSAAFAQPTFAMRMKPSQRALTTPIAYLQALPIDPFAPTGGAMYCYFRSEDKKGGIIFGAGPDRDYDLNPAQILSTADEDITKVLATETYDMTNGTISSGDVWRMVGTGK